VLHEDPDFLQEVKKVSCLNFQTNYIHHNIVLIHSYNKIR
jgi:hypothetical protein